MSGRSLVTGGGPDQAARRKRLGQFFTGTQLARLLATLAGVDEVNSVIDPFLGTGDMLVACQDGKAPRIAAGIEIDPPAIDEARRRLATAELVAGDSFSKRSLRGLSQTTFDLVITNPPYVRYQAQSQSKPEHLELPDAVRVRTNLLGALQSLDLFPHLTTAERDLLTALTVGYSGLADLAVPAWILSAAFTQCGGTLAMVVPESWLSRDYARAVHYLLLRMFRIRYVVEDAHASWFSDAMVKTTLLVADRIPCRSSAYDWDEQTFVSVSVRANAKTATSVVGAAFIGDSEPERELHRRIAAVSRSGEAVNEATWEARPTRIRDKAANLRASAMSEDWIRRLEPAHAQAASDAIFLPEALRNWLGGQQQPSLTTLENLGFEVGQGLRTGANDFFYVDVVSAKNEVTLVATSEGAILDVPSECLRAALRKQSELVDGYAIDPTVLSGRALVLEGWALPEDISEVSDEMETGGMCTVRSMPDVLADHVRDIGRGKIPRMSAVRTNVRPARAGKSGRQATDPRWWYTLPPFQLRHQPDIVIPRVNNKCPRPLINVGRQSLVDANFSSIWQREGRSHVHAILALLNSSWCLAAMELMGAVMGGGALKLEATHLAKLPVPRLGDDDWLRLGRLGEALVEGSGAAEVISEIDNAVVTAVLGDSADDRLVTLRQMREEQQEKRCTRI